MSVESIENAQEIMVEMGQLVDYFENLNINTVGDTMDEVESKILAKEEELEALVLGTFATVKTVKTVTFNLVAGGPAVDLVAEYVSENGGTCACHAYSLESVKLVHCGWEEEFTELTLTERQREQIQFFLEFANAEYTHAEGEDCQNY